MVKSYPPLTCSDFRTGGQTGGETLAGAADPRSVAVAVLPANDQVGGPGARRGGDALAAKREGRGGRAGPQAGATDIRLLLRLSLSTAGTVGRLVALQGRG